METAEHHRGLLPLHQLAGDGDALGGIALVVADHHLELAPAEEPALGVHLVHGDLYPALDRLAGRGRAAGDGGGEPDLDGLLGLGAHRDGEGGKPEQCETEASQTAHGDPPWGFPR
jgi:hypothetical protein